MAPEQAPQPCHCRHCLTRSAFRCVAPSPASCQKQAASPPRSAPTILTAPPMMMMATPIAMSGRRADAGGAPPSYTCSICNTKFTRKSNLNRHQLVHTGAKRYACHICAQPFSLRYNLKRHLVKQHALSGFPPNPTESGSTQSV